MTNLTRHEDLFEHLFGFRRDFDELFNRLLGGSSWAPTRLALVQPEIPPTEVWVDKEGKKYHARVALPGIDPKDVQLNLEGNTLSIRAERKETKEKKEVDYLRREFSYGVFDRVLALPEGADADKIIAEFNNGVLEITAPMAAAALPRRIEIKGVAKPKIASAA
jgi:HSP20 family protein